ncbi:MAG: cytochrome P450 [Caldimonas sp.]
MSAPRRYEDIPGPRGVPFFGNAFQLDKTRAHEQFAEWVGAHGPYVRVRIGPRQLLLVADHAVIGSVLRDRPERFRRPTNHAAIAREMGFEEGLFFANDDVWKRQRRMVMAALDPGHVKAFFPSLKTVVRRLEGRWRKAAETGKVIDLQADLMRYTVDAIAGLAFGADVNTLESDEDVIQRHLNRIFPALARRSLASVPYWRYVPLPADRRLDESVREVKAAIARFIAEARQRLRDDAALRAHPRNLLEAMIVAADAPGSEVDDRDVAGNVFVALVAGEDTTANTLAWLFDFLHRHPEAMRGAREEVQRVAPRPQDFTLEQMADLPFIDACINETMRLKPVAPLLPSQANHDTVVGDVAVPANTFVVCVMRPDALQERHFPNPTAFAPERWLAATPDAPSARSTTRVSMPFGAGPRLCPGRYLALLEMKMAIAMLLGGFTIDRVGTRDGSPARELFAFAMGPVGLEMRLAPAA